MSDNDKDKTDLYTKYSHVINNDPMLRKAIEDRVREVTVHTHTHAGLDAPNTELRQLHNDSTELFSTVEVAQLRFIYELAKTQMEFGIVPAGGKLEEAINKMEKWYEATGGKK